MKKMYKNDATILIVDCLFDVIINKKMSYTLFSSRGFSNLHTENKTNYLIKANYLIKTNLL